MGTRYADAVVSPTSMETLGGEHGFQPVMESPEDRLRRFEGGPPAEVISTLLNSINNGLNGEIRLAAEAGCWSLVIMATHAVALTVSEGLFDLTGQQGYARFLRTFVDQPDPGQDFSTIGAEVHRWRNVLAHQWLATAGHTFGLDTAMDRGWERRGTSVVVNPARYYAAYRRAFTTSSPLWRPESLLSDAELDGAKDRLIRKYLAR
jgi:hypothetical protein